MSAITDDVTAGRDQTVRPPTKARGPRAPGTPRQQRRPPGKRSPADRSVRDARAAAPTGGPLPLIIGRWGMRGMEDLSVEELAQLHQKLAGWIRQRAHAPERTERRPWVMHPHMAHPPDRRESP
jgi:hypothetical protein